MKTINYKEELSSYCENLCNCRDDYYSMAEVIKAANLDETADPTATFLRVEPIPENEDAVYWVYWCNLCKQEEKHLKEYLKDYVYIGECPVEENPFSNFTTNITCRVFAQQLLDTYPVPEGGKLRIKSEIGGGGYYEVVADYNLAYPKSFAWALYLEGNTPEKWSPKALKTLAKMKGE